MALCANFLGHSRWFGCWCILSLGSVTPHLINTTVSWTRNRNKGDTGVAIFSMAWWTEKDILSALFAAKFKPIAPQTQRSFRITSPLNAHHKRISQPSILQRSNNSWKCRSKFCSSRWYTLASALVKLSFWYQCSWFQDSASSLSKMKVTYMLSYWVVKQLKKHTICKDLIMPCVEDVIKTVLGEKNVKEVKQIPCLNDAVGRQICEMVSDVETQVIECTPWSSWLPWTRVVTMMVTSSWWHLWSMFRAARLC